MNRFAFIVPITKSYLHEGRPLLRSLNKWHPDIPVHVLTTDLMDEDFVGIGNGYKADILVHTLPNYDEPAKCKEFRRIRTSRFLFATQVAEHYDVVCILDADMILVRPILQFFKMAETGTILVGGNNTLLRYTKKDFDAMQVPVRDDINVVHTTFCTVPVFINPTLQKDYLLAIWNNPTGNDLDVPNLVAASMGKMGEIFLLETYQWLNIHHSMLKPETHIVSTSDGLYSHQGVPVYMLHGHWGDQNYIKGLMEPMEKNYGWHKPYLHTAENAINDLVKEYAKYKD